MPLIAVPSDPDSSGLSAAASAGIAIVVLFLLLLIVFVIGYIIHKNSQKDEPLIRPEQDPPAEIHMHSSCRPRSRKYVTETNAMYVPPNTMPEIDDKDKVPALTREKTQHSNLRKQIVTPSVVNPVVRDREHTDVGESRDNDKLPPLTREKTQYSNLKKQVATPSVVNPMVRDRAHADVGESGDRDKLPPLTREKTQYSNLRKQIVTPSVVNPMVRDREYTDVGDSDKIIFLQSGM